MRRHDFFLATLMVAVALLAPVDQGSDDYMNERMNSRREMDAPVEAQTCGKAPKGRRKLQA